MTSFNTPLCAKNKQPKQYSDLMLEWLECQDFILAMKGASSCTTPFNICSLRHYQKVANKVVSGQRVENKLVREGLLTFIAASDDAYSFGHHIAFDIEGHITPVQAQLGEVPLADKREVMRYAAIIPSPIAAAYVGVSERALNKWTKLNTLFGATYAGGHCYSLEELKMIRNNRFWICESSFAENHTMAWDDEKSLDEVLMVDYDVAAAFAEMTDDELGELPINQMPKRPFRLSDLEKIRVAKLSTIAEK